MAFLTLNSISIAKPDFSAILVSDLSASFGAERTGLVGRNGSGKSSLINVMAGRVAPTSGTVSRNGSVGYLRQSFEDLSITVSHALGAENALKTIKKIVSGEGNADDLSGADWTLEPRIEETLARLGLSGLPLTTKLSHLSGGQRMRISLGRIILEAPDILLLDEPTNNLDLEGRDAVANVVSSWRGGVVVAGHDRALLDSMDRILELSQTGTKIYQGGWFAYKSEKTLEVTRAEATLDRVKRELKSKQTAIQREKEKKERRDKTGRANRAKGSDPRVSLDRQKGRAENSLGRQGLIAEKVIGRTIKEFDDAAEQVEILTPIQITLPSAEVPTNKIILDVLDAEVSYPNGVNLGPWNLQIRGRERVRLLGVNGVGKSTFMKLVVGHLSLIKGSVERTTHYAYLDQDLIAPNPQGDLLENMLLAQPDINQHAAREALAHFGFRNIAVERKIGTLSGGERLRLSLCMIASGSNQPELLLLDEPTNHLDTEAIELLEKTLEQYEGALLCITHDESFAAAVSFTRTIRLK